MTSCVPKIDGHPTDPQNCFPALSWLVGRTYIYLSGPSPKRDLQRLWPATRTSLLTKASQGRGRLS
jgi:hypothetical protein